MNNKNFIKYFYIALLLTSAAIINTGCSQGDGACLVGSGISQGCTDSTSGQCGLLNGKFQGKSTSCADLGFTSN